MVLGGKEVITITASLIGVGLAVIFTALIFSTDEEVWRRRSGRLRWGLRGLTRRAELARDIEQDERRIERVAAAVRKMTPPPSAAGHRKAA